MTEIAQGGGGRTLRNLGWLMIITGFFTMLVGLFLEQASTPTLSSLGLLLVLSGIGILVREVEQGKESGEPRFQKLEKD
ncbi:MAG: hypothetical protein JSW01_04170 [Candidatus Bathyarchaeota archaeon]|nr:MAG: hypothetical protein JSW01_04170 [Candidatus Bathyarchaeota archaeon]